MPLSLDSAYDECKRIALHYENFPVGSILVPKHLRKHFYALYAYMRVADDFADTGGDSDIRLNNLEQWRGQLQHILSGGSSEHPVFIALCNTLSECNLPSQSLERLLEAFEFDARGVVRFETFDDLRWYTSRSADPVGELVLALFSYHSQKLIGLSNDICTALQLLNFIQDIREDLEAKRYYFPLEDQRIFFHESAPIQAENMTQLQFEPLAMLCLFETDRVESLLDKGSPIVDQVEGRLKYELRAIILSARRLITKIRKLDGNTYIHRPTLSKRERFIVLLQSFYRGGSHR